ncbi:MAG: hypothetical protein ACE5EH_02525 [Gammaproteobacteria bacterium]
MQEPRYDLGTHHSKSLSELPEVEYDAVVTMGYGDGRPAMRAAYRIDWGIPDPEHMNERVFREVRGSD